MQPLSLGSVIRHATAIVTVSLLCAMPVQSQERRIILSEDSDYFGADYETLKDVDLKQCEAACIADNRCNAFTYNTSARWCFMKQDFGGLKHFKGAIAGRITVTKPRAKSMVRQRTDELTFIDKSLIDESRRLPGQLKQYYDPAGSTYSVLYAAGADAYRSGKAVLSARQFGSALILAPDDMQLWYRFSLALLSSKSKKWKERNRIERFGTAAAINTYIRTESKIDRADALVVLARALQRRRFHKNAIHAYRASLKLAERQNIRKLYDKVMAAHGFRITSHEVDADAASPRICVVFSQRLNDKRPNMSDFVDLRGGDGLAVTVESNQICVDGVSHGQRYQLTLRTGLPAADGEELERPVNLNIYVRDRSPAVRFVGKAYVLPRGKGATIPIVSVNTKIIAATIHRIGDRGLTGAMTDNFLLKQLEGWRADSIGENRGEEVWKGEIDVAPQLNVDVTTAIPIGEAVRTLKPGAYVMTAKAKSEVTESWKSVATQWFIITDLGLTSMTGSDGLHAFVRSLGSADPKAGVRLRLMAVNNEILGEAITDKNGYGKFAAGLTRGKAGMAPALLVAEASDRDYAFLDLTKSAFDLTDRGVDGRAAPGPVDAFMYTDRGVYRPGETVHAVSLIRDGRGVAMPKLPLTMVFTRPDGVEQQRIQTQDSGAGGHTADLQILPGAMRGMWRLAAYLDPKASPVSEATFLVEDFQPERIDFEVSTAETRLDLDRPAAFDLTSRYLYGAPAGDLPVEAEILIRAAKSGLKAYPGYRFGLANEKVHEAREPVDASIQTDAGGNAKFVVQLPDVSAPTRLLEAELITRIRDSGGRSVERSVKLPVAPRGPRIGIRPLFEDDQADENSQAGFEVIMVDSAGKRLARRDLSWTLHRIETSYQWYRSDGRWRYESFSRTERIADGNLSVDPQNPARIAVPVKWGNYRLEITSDKGRPTASSVAFNAGWVTSGDAAATPDMLPTGLDKTAYKVGDVARLHIEPRFAGKAIVSVIDNRLIESRVIEVGAEGTTVELPVTEAWGAGAYVVTSLFRPMNVEQKRMPTRALGLVWANVDPQERKLSVRIAGEDIVRPRGPVEMDIVVDNVQEGQEVFVTVAAVDLGILNLTGYKAPAPGDWYFGQRRLGTEIRDLYGELIDRMQGVRGKVRSGGDLAPPGMKGSPPVDDLVAFFSGIRQVDANGKVHVVVDIPDFNGTARVMAVAWSAQGVGHAVKDVISRDPVVITSSLPQYLAPGDESRVLFDFANVEGAPGTYALSVESDGGLTIEDGNAHRSFDLAREGRNIQVIPIRASKLGRHTLSAVLVGPNGNEFHKSMDVVVRSGEQPVTRTNVVNIPAGGKLTVDSELANGLFASTVSATLAVSRAARLDVPGLLQALDRYPYGCSEQLTSRALPLVYLSSVARSAGLADDDEIRKRVDKAIAGILANQSAGGSFGLWRPASGDYWLDAYISDFLTRAREAGYTVQDTAFNLALDNLANRMSYSSDITDGGEDIAYAVYVLARNGRAAIGDLRYFADAQLSSFDSPLAKAQIGAALALYGERSRADMAFKSAMSDLTGGARANDWRKDYGSYLRDSAAILTLAAEAKSTPVNLLDLVDRISERKTAVRYTSTQEKAWMLLAAHALIDADKRNNLAIDGEPMSGALYRKFAPGYLSGSPVVIENRGTENVEAMLTATGIPITPEPATSAGYKITRSYYDLEGRQIDISTVGQNTRFVTVLTITQLVDEAARLVIADPLPAGFAIDNPNLLRSGDISTLKWLKLPDSTRHTEFRADKFVAAVDRDRGAGRDFHLAYIARAVSPGTYAHPAATVEDMYRPYRYGRMDSGTVNVVGPRQ